jgi:hypothetical protein
MNEDKMWEMTAMFQFSQDEKTIYIVAIVFSSRDLGD